jgi:hypothetical protein
VYCSVIPDRACCSQHCRKEETKICAGEEGGAVVGIVCDAGMNGLRPLAGMGLPALPVAARLRRREALQVADREKAASAASQPATSVDRRVFTFSRSCLRF